MATSWPRGMRKAVVIGKHVSPTGHAAHQPHTVEPSHERDDDTPPDARQLIELAVTFNERLPLRFSNSTALGCAALRRSKPVQDIGWERMQAICKAGMALPLPAEIAQS